jgi:hypothetical protein
MGRKSTTTPKAKMAANNMDLERKKALLGALDTIPVKLHSYFKDMLNANLFEGTKKIMAYICKLDENNEAYYNQIIELTREKEVLSKELESLKGKTETIDLFVIENCLRMIKFHLTKVKETTGEITEDDINYCINLTGRILAKQGGNNAHN